MEWARVLSQDSDCTQRCAAAALDLHRQRDYNGAPRRQLVEVRQVLEGRNVALVQHAMRFKERRLAVIDARRIEPDGLHLPRLGEPLRRVLVQTRKVQLGDSGLPTLGG